MRINAAVTDWVDSSMDLETTILGWIPSLVTGGSQG